MTLNPYIMATIDLILSFIFLISMVAAVYLSVRGRRSESYAEAELYRARMNISLGLMMLALGAFQLTAYTPLSAVRVVVALVFLGIGAVNLLGGWRNHTLANRRFKKEQTAD
jgi:hypothetical protein